jgi:hypothetical protein
MGFGIGEVKPRTTGANALRQSARMFTTSDAQLQQQYDMAHLESSRLCGFTRARFVAADPGAHCVQRQK